MGLCAMSYEERRSSYSFIDSQMNSMDDDDDNNRDDYILNIDTFSHLKIFNSIVAKR